VARHSQVRLGVTPEINAISTLLIAAVSLGVLAASLIAARPPYLSHRHPRRPAPPGRNQRGREHAEADRGDEQGLPPLKVARLSSPLWGGGGGGGGAGENSRSTRHHPRLRTTRSLRTSHTGTPAARPRRAAISEAASTPRLTGRWTTS
jgi:hypothetical protein